MSHIKTQPGDYMPTSIYKDIDIDEMLKKDISSEEYLIKNIKMQDDGSMVFEAWASRVEMDRGRDIILAEAFTPSVINKYMAKPIVLFNHMLFDEPAIGKTLEIKAVQGEGLWVKILIKPTTRGKDIILLIQAGIINSLSVGLFVKMFEYDKENDIRKITEVKELIEISVVNLGQNELATIIKQAEEMNLVLKSFADLKRDKNVNVICGGNKKVDIDEIKKIIDDNRTSISQAVATVNDVRKEVAELTKVTTIVKEFSERSDAEKKELIEKVRDDAQRAVEALDKAVKEIHKNRNVYGSVKSSTNFEIKHLVEMPDWRMERLFTKEKCEEINQVKKLADAVHIVDKILEAGNVNYAREDRTERIKKLSIYKEFISKAMDTGTSNEGSEYVPSATFTASFSPLVRQNLVVAGMHPSSPMTQASQTDLVEGADTLATRATETKTYVSAFNSTEQTPGSANVTFTAEKLRGRTQYSGEATEDMIISVVDYITMKVARSVARAIEKATISGDDAGGTAFDTGDTPGSTDCRYCWNGYRQECQTANKINLSTFSLENLTKMRAKGGKYFANPADWFWLTSIETYLMHFLNPAEIEEVITIDKMGPLAVIVTGQLANLMGAPIVTSEFVLNTYNSSGVYDGVEVNKSIVLGVHRASHKYGVHKPLEIEIVRDAINDVYDVVGYWRGDFKCIFDATAEDVVVLGYGVTTS